jgi:hypothetical protein
MFKDSVDAFVREDVDLDARSLRAMADELNHSASRKLIERMARIGPIAWILESDFHWPLP